MASPAVGRPKGPTCRFGHPYTQGTNRQFCQVCKNEATKRWKEANPETNSEMRRETMLKSKYNITIEQYQLMWEEQEGLCAACGEAMPTKDDRGYFPPVDHDHETNKIRGIVHTKCNRGIGLFNDSPDRMRKVADYLERNQ